ncbi:hypothetical protein [Natrinema gelatinilyticum]|uniref:hypothetical protein n=1 Tax=Natrinema gelatinilyticum TaxID=2961571 RepID=UPI0020C287C5|nr:hypothetical protein [Natrinema gelatinilyticum]
MVDRSGPHRRLLAEGARRTGAAEDTAAVGGVRAETGSRQVSVAGLSHKKPPGATRDAEARQQAPC